MKKLKVNLIDYNLGMPTAENPYVSVTPFIGAPELIEYIKPGLQEWPGVTVFTDNCIAPPYPTSVNSRFKVAYIIEPPSVHSAPYEQVVQHEKYYDYILTYDDRLLARGPKYVLFGLGTTQVLDEDAGVHTKSKLLSMIASKKTFAPGHRLRHEIISAINDIVTIDLWGEAYQRFDIDNKPSRDEPLKDYMFSIVVRNERMNNYFGEQIIDCFRMGTVPIFWGCPNIGDFFNLDGIIHFENISELIETLQTLTKEDYDRILSTGAVHDNFERAKCWRSVDNNLALKLKELFGEKIQIE